jgi:CsoR family transcriptional regulator, copper-sensing transcriptional repressor
MERTNSSKLRNRLSRIEGQVRGVSKMIEEDRYCIDILAQIRAARSALAGVEKELLKQHLDHCIVGAMASGDEAEQRKKADELIELLAKSGG